MERFGWSCYDGCPFAVKGRCIYSDLIGVNDHTLASAESFPASDNRTDFFFTILNMPVYTKKGDDGKTGLFKNWNKSEFKDKNNRISKSSQIIKALGAIDEVNSFLGILKIKIQKSKHKNTSKKSKIEGIQSDLMFINSVLAGSKIDIKGLSDKVIKMEEEIDKMEKKLPPLKNFILPGGSEVSSYLMYARTLVRRAEYELVSLKSSPIYHIPYTIYQYTNRLSDYLFILARWVNFKEKIKEKVWILNKQQTKNSKQ